MGFINFRLLQLDNGLKVILVSDVQKIIDLDNLSDKNSVDSENEDSNEESGNESISNDSEVRFINFHK